MCQGRKVDWLWLFVFCVSNHFQKAILSSHVLQTIKKQKDIFANKQKNRKTIDNDGMTDGRQIIIIFFPVILRQIG